MKTASQLLVELKSGALTAALDEAQVACGKYPSAAERAAALVELFIESYGDREVSIVSVPGRTELGGNHTDHQRGRVLAASVNMDILAVVSPSEEDRVRLRSVGFRREDNVDLSVLEPQDNETSHSPALIRGVARWFSDHGLPVKGFDAYTQSEVPAGSGLSSSAAFEVAVGAAFRLVGGVDIDNVELAKAGQYAENVFFGKPCGLLDQTACAHGGVVEMDFIDPTSPQISATKLDLKKLGYALCISLTGGHHSDLTDDYAAVPAEMREVAAQFGREVLRDIDPADFYAALPDLRGKLSDRALLRAIHFFNENERVLGFGEALREGDFAKYLRCVSESGRSSWELLQNVFSPASASEQGVSLALAISERVLGGEGACRVHGGGFAGTIQAYVPQGKVEAYRAELDRVFGEGSCRVLSIRHKGACVIA